MAAAAAVLTALFRPSTAQFLYSKHRLCPRFSRLCCSSLASSQFAIPNVVDILRERGLVDSITSHNLKSACSIPNNTPLKVCCTFDATAGSLHLENLIGLIVLAWFRRCGHQTVALLCDPIGRIGDPSGKSLERPELGVETLEIKSAEIRDLVYRILHRANKEIELKMGCSKDEILNSDSEDSGNLLVLNDDWWKEITFLDFVLEVGRYARVGTMMAKESLKKLLMSEDGLSYTEFTYQLLQAYDFFYMFKNMGVNVQIGGRDQWENIVAGTELIRKILRVEGAHGLAFPLLLKSDGSKFGKSEDGVIWLSPAMLSPYKFYQYFFSVPDVDVVRFLKILTFLNLEEIHELEDAMKRPGYVPNSAQRRLAEEVTRFVHGKEGLVEAVNATKALMSGAETELDPNTIEGIVKDVPSCSLPYDRVLNSLLVEISVISGFLGSKSAARRLLKQGGLYLNNKRVDHEGKRIEEFDIVSGKLMLLSAGKKKKMVIKIS
ncbi:tyrosine--tRNA ligase, chloroplastic/mitochondrial-like [Phalaenopsis equestris]|uniref:tyrosine--tRNA ligase, chloroplastic/mitochondrial-like n=1 Tax=Phalaenopsis equestris TaxID=78828 RepID=UPI0009E56A59|nr:tyrosine--tRNA ligase, chloroplastic/mitochondrial-like [Phalaenopsis equestris]XP_020588209.1 tyrosine--tRNA ligase, chloroplastic/mitochondrial-like [Phalaenopsis equestris]XP_020588210.1 tyrosine--tRNA ligase, chloroplastic/mitochondrial-like [Phalaenopsis equestris]